MQMFSRVRHRPSNCARVKALSSQAVPLVFMSQVVPTSIPNILTSGVPVLGICYGHQLLAHHLGGKVQKGERGEYGVAHLTVASTGCSLERCGEFADLDESSRYRRVCASGFSRHGLHGDLGHSGDVRSRAQTLRLAVSSGGRAYPCRYADLRELCFRRLWRDKRLGCFATHSGRGRTDSRGCKGSERLLLCERRRRFDSRVYALPESFRAKPRLWHLCRHGADAEGRDRVR